MRMRMKKQKIYIEISRDILKEKDKKTKDYGEDTF